MTAARRTRRSIDWGEVRERLSRAEMHDTTEVSAERARAIMDERARLLARAEPLAPAAGETLDVITFSLALEAYAIETRYVREVVRLVDLTPVPGTPAAVAGVTNHRGQVLCVMDLRSLFEVPARGLTDLSRLIVLGVERIEFGILADRADDIRTLPVADVLPPATTVAGAGRAYLHGVTRDALMVLDGAWLLDDARLCVDQGRIAG
jgi:purine-binding chemotaxis protein CheW